MEQIKTYNFSQRSVYKLDRKSDRFRICPQCGLEHMVIHRGRDFCSDKCCDDYNNGIKRLQRHAQITEPEIEEISALEEQIECESSGQELTLTPTELSTDIEGNLAILGELTLDTKKGSHFYLQDLLEKGFNFPAYSDRVKLHNIDPEHQSHYLMFGKYRIYSIDNGKVLIVKEV